MRIHMPRTFVLAATLFTLTACSGEEGGTALPTEQPPSSSAGPASPSTSPADGSSPLTGLDPCSLLGAAELGELGTFSEGVPNELGGARGCDFAKQSKSASEDSVGVTVAVRDAQGVAEVIDLGNGKQTGTVGEGRDAVRTSANGTCLIALAVTETSRVDVGAVTTSDEKACEIADAVAAIVEPKLPEG
jgi:predicted small lipoprotein YifL